MIRFWMMSATKSTPAIYSNVIRFLSLAEKAEIAARLCKTKLFLCNQRFLQEKGYLRIYNLIYFKIDFRTEGAASTIKFTCLVESRLRSTIVNDFECAARPPQGFSQTSLTDNL